MANGPSTHELTITVDAKTHQHITDAAAREGVSVSTWMTSAAQRALKVHDGKAAMGEWDNDQHSNGDQAAARERPAAHGGLTAAELVAARRRVSARAERGSEQRAR